VQDLTSFRGELTAEKLVSLWHHLQALFRNLSHLNWLQPFCGVFCKDDEDKILDPLKLHSLQSTTRSTKQEINTLIQWLALSNFKVLQSLWQPIVQHKLPKYCTA
jgi:hypothetical protein